MDLPSFRHTQKNPRNEQSVEILHYAHERHDNPPCHHDTGQPHTRPQLLQQQVTGHLERGVSKEENLIPTSATIFPHPRPR
jgi:hypothetical protein